MQSHTNALKLVAFAPFRSQSIYPGITNRSTTLIPTASIVHTKTARVQERVSRDMIILHGISLTSTVTCKSDFHYKVKEGRSLIQSTTLGWPLECSVVLSVGCLGTLKLYVHIDKTDLEILACWLVDITITITIYTSIRRKGEG